MKYYRMYKYLKACSDNFSFLTCCIACRCANEVDSYDLACDIQGDIAEYL